MELRVVVVDMCVCVCVCVCVFDSFFICSPTDEHLGCLPVLAMVNKAAVSMGVRLSYFKRV